MISHSKLLISVYQTCMSQEQRLKRLVDLRAMQLQRWLLETTITALQVICGAWVSFCMRCCVGSCLMKTKRRLISTRRSWTPNTPSLTSSRTKQKIWSQKSSRQILTRELRLLKSESIRGISWTNQRLRHSSCAHQTFKLRAARQLQRTVSSAR